MPLERQLLSAFKGESASLTYVVRRLGPELLRTARRYVRSDDVAEEVVQDTWLAAWTGFGRFQGRCSARTWLLRILVNRARTRGARDARVLPFAALGPAAPTTPEQAQPWSVSRTDDPERALLRGEAARALGTALKSLPERQRRVVERRDLEECSAHDLCCELAVSEVNQRVLLHRARSGLRLAMGESWALPA